MKIGYNGISWEIEDVKLAADSLGIELVSTEDTADCDALWGEYSVEQIESAAKLRWFQSTWAGVDAFSHAKPFKDGTAVLCNSSGAFNITISEYLIGGCLALLRHFPDYLRAQADHLWHPHIPAQTLRGKRITVLGMGNIGRTFAEAATALGANVTGVTRKNTDSLPELLPETDILVMILPSTPATKGLIGAKELALLPEGAYVLNAGRGSTLDIQALMEGLMSGRIAGALLDVYPEEPVPEDTLLWDMPNLIMTPHIAGANEDEANNRRINEIFIENLKHWAGGEPLRNVVK